MKRIGNIFNRIIDFNNLVLADKKARLNKSKRYGVDMVIALIYGRDLQEQII